MYDCNIYIELYLLNMIYSIIAMYWLIFQPTEFNMKYDTCHKLVVTTSWDIKPYRVMEYFNGWPAWLMTHSVMNMKVLNFSLIFFSKKKWISSCWKIWGKSTSYLWLWWCQTISTYVHVSILQIAISKQSCTSHVICWIHTNAYFIKSKLKSTPNSQSK